MLGDTVVQSVFLSGFGPRRGKTAICNLVGGGMALSTCTALTNLPVPRGGRE